METLLNRIVAFLIDASLVSFIGGFIATSPTGEFVLTYGMVTISASTYMVLYLAYFMLFDLVNEGQTVGKAVVGIRISKLDLKHRFLRSILKTFSIMFAPVTIIVYLYSKVVLHDYLLSNRNAAI